MDLTKMLEYQDLDKEVFRLENELMNSAERKNANALQIKYKQTQEAIVRLNTQAEVVIGGVEKLQAKYDKLNAELSELGDAAETVDDLKEIDFYEKRLGDIVSAMEALEKEITNAVRELNGIYAQGTGETKLLQGVAAKYQEALKAYDTRKKQVQAEAAEYMMKMRALESELPAKILEVYKRIRGNKKMPVLVKLIGENTCGGCGMELSITEVGKLDSNGICECPNCGRVVYKG